MDDRLKPYKKCREELSIEVGRLFGEFEQSYRRSVSPRCYKSFIMATLACQGSNRLPEATCGGLV